MKSLVLIPARYQSSRFPGKPLCQIQGQSMISRVVENLQSPEFDVAVVTDDTRIESHLKEQGKQVFRVDDPVESGTERIYLALERFVKESYPFVINVQGDEPLLKAQHLKALVKFHQEKQNLDITTLYRSRTDSEISNPNIVKIALTQQQECLYFSRAAIPYDRSGNNKNWSQHVGVYCYRPQALKSFCAHNPTMLEKREALEQLRALSLGLKIGALEIQDVLVGVDTPEDIALVEKYL